MIQFNLLPDVKLEYIRAQRTRRLIIGVSLIVSAAALVILILLLGTNQLGKKHLTDLSKDIKTKSSKLQKQPKINDILTVQNQLQSLTALHQGKPAVIRLFDYLNRLTPTDISITNFTTDYAAHTIVITGTSNALSTVNQYIDTLKYTKYQVKPADKTADSSAVTPEEQLPAFNSIVLTSFGLANNAQGATQTAGKEATYSITLAYDPVIFDISNDVTLTIPSQVTTRASSANVNPLFTESITPATGTTSATAKGTR